MKLGMHLGVVKHIDSYLIHFFDASHAEPATSQKGQNALKLLRFLKISATVSCILGNLASYYDRPDLALSIDA